MPLLSGFQTEGPDQENNKLRVYRQDLFEVEIIHIELANVLQ